MVRRIHEAPSWLWHQELGKLLDTHVLDTDGACCCPEDTIAAYDLSIPLGTVSYDQILVATGDMGQWVLFSKDQFGRSDANISASSEMEPFMSLASRLDSDYADATVIDYATDLAISGRNSDLNVFIRRFPGHRRQLEDSIGIVNGGFEDAEGSTETANYGYYSSYSEIAGWSTDSGGARLLVQQNTEDGWKPNTEWDGIYYLVLQGNTFIRQEGFTDVEPGSFFRASFKAATRCCSDEWEAETLLVKLMYSVDKETKEVLIFGERLTETVSSYTADFQIPDGTARRPACEALLLR
ncbi:hypothetical protein CYMTET_50759 [Cymbomonas tetramitiformis]|uniref:Uncharacterized protein n=1 Tax=Cymbomonas tetramitiformis TaxID=36881 RepID=A0AAE0BPF4_9CHLO|nr:hypothetical protein CYMTET_50759 [Cymbomonas tetramitiformis]